MEITVWWLVLIIGALLSAAGAFIWLVFKLDSAPSRNHENDKDYFDLANRQIEQIFNKEFREELRNHGHLYFEKVINENAMFLKQDLQLTTSQINDFMMKEIGKKLQEAFAMYEQAIKDTQARSIDSINQVTVAAERQQEILAQQLNEALERQKDQLFKSFERNMSDVINHYLADAIGNQMDLDDQIGYILGELEANKQAMREDMYA